MKSLARSNTSIQISQQRPFVLLTMGACESTMDTRHCVVAPNSQRLALHSGISVFADAQLCAEVRGRCPSKIGPAS
jgi:hypothetical protein